MTVGRKKEVRWWSERDRERLPPRDPGHNPSSPTASSTVDTPITLSFHSCVEQVSPGSYYAVTKTLKTPSFPPVWEKNSDSSNHSWGTVLSIPHASADPSPQCPDVDTETQGSDEERGVCDSLRHSEFSNSTFNLFNCPPHLYNKSGIINPEGLLPW